MRNIFSFLSIMIPVFAFAQCNNIPVASDTQYQKETKNVTKGEIKSPINEANIEGDFQIPNITNTSLDTLITYSAPKISFVFTCKPEDVGAEFCKDINLNLECPLEVRKIINDYWKKSISLQYDMIMESDQMDGQTYYQRNKTIFATSSDFTKNLQNIFISTPNGQRLISTKEADEIAYFINTSSIRLIEQAKIHESQRESKNKIPYGRATGY